MNYRKNRYGEPISILGYGCMRFTRKGSSVDIDKAERELMAAIGRGVNYLDTAYIYPGSEAAVGEILKRNGARDRVNLATKLPQYLIGNRAAIDRYFNEELTRLQTDRVDYYLMHMLTDVNAWRKLQRLGIEEWIAEKKSSGAIRNIGFSFHGSTEMFLEILEAYDWDFCQIQYNYVDEVSQAGVKGLKAAHAKGIPVIIMEPLRGGKLVDLLPEGAKKRIAADNGRRAESGLPARTAAELAFTWLWNQPEVTCVLSGMNSTEMVEENCRIASSAEAGCFTEEDFSLIRAIREEISAKIKGPCTGCRYCMPCPQGVDIPGAFAGYNAMFTENKGSGRWQYLQTVALRKEKALPTQCIGCGKCESHCPQHISIISELKKANRALRPLPYRIAGAVMRRFMMRKT